jgi:DNA-directed RNA polymerase specialized sigma24 family protein
MTLYEAFQVLRDPASKMAQSAEAKLRYDKATELIRNHISHRSIRAPLRRSLALYGLEDDDVAQVVTFRISSGKATHLTLENEQSVIGWLWTVANNEAVSQIRKFGRKVQSEDSESSNGSKDGQSGSNADRKVTPPPDKPQRPDIPNQVAKSPSTRISPPPPPAPTSTSIWGTPSDTAPISESIVRMTNEEMFAAVREQYLRLTAGIPRVDKHQLVDRWVLTMEALLRDKGAPAARAVLFAGTINEGTIDRVLSRFRTKVYETLLLAPDADHELLSLASLFDDTTRERERKKTKKGK